MLSPEVAGQTRDSTFAVPIGSLIIADIIKFVVSTRRLGMPSLMRLVVQDAIVRGLFKLPKMNVLT